MPGTTPTQSRTTSSLPGTAPPQSMTTSPLPGKTPPPTTPLQSTIRQHSFCTGGFGEMSFPVGPRSRGRPPLTRTRHTVKRPKSDIFVEETDGGNNGKHDHIFLHAEWKC